MSCLSDSVKAGHVGYAKNVLSSVAGFALTHRPFGLRQAPAVNL